MLRPPSRPFLEDPTGHEVEDVAIGRILGTLAERRPFPGRQLAFETVEQPIQDAPLALVQRLPCLRFPETRLPQRGLEHRLRALDGAVEATQEPFEPLRDIERPFLGLL